MNLAVELVLDEMVSHVAERISTGGTAETVAVDRLAGSLGHHA
jgi:hypothetical protein